MLYWQTERQRPFFPRGFDAKVMGRIVPTVAIVLLAIGSGTGDLFATETNCTALVEEAYTLVYQGTDSPETVSSMLESYRDRLLGCSVTPVDDGKTFLLASIDYLEGRVAHSRGDQRLAEEKFVSVIDDMERLIDEGNESSGVLTLLADAYIARAEYKGKFYGMRIIREVRRLLEEAVALNPLDGRAHVSIARYYLNAPTALGGDLSKAQEHAEIARRSPDEVVTFDALLLLSNIHSELGDGSRSEDAIAQAAEIFPSNGRVQ